MSLSNAQTIACLNTLVNLNQSSEIGFTHAAEHVRNRGLKIYLRSYAAQRAQFAEELRQAIARLGGKLTPATNPLAVLHRGWVDILATLTIGRINQARVVLQESLHGEHMALCTYRDAAQGQHPSAIHTMLETHIAHIEAAHDHLSSIIAYHPNVLLVQLFERADSAQAAVTNLLAAGVAATQIRVTPVNQIPRHQHKFQRQLMGEGMIACALLGIVAGIVLDLLMSMPLVASGMHTAEVGSFGIPLFISALLGLAGGVILGCLIRQGVSEDDAHFYSADLQHDSVIVTVRAAQTPVRQVHQILEMQRDQERQAAVALAGSVA